jgi:ribosomal protein S18 acetylase RimI-like enzyme
MAARVGKLRAEADGGRNRGDRFLGSTTFLRRGSYGMLTFRPFRNTDPPLLTALWRAHVGRPGMPGHITCELLEQLVFSKLYFDHEGLILAVDDERLVGLVHAGFGPNEARNALAHQTGVISLLLVHPGSPPQLAVDLVERAENYLQSRGAREVFGGGVSPACPFYTGLYGLSEPPGVFDHDEVFRDALLARGFRPSVQTLTFQRDLEGFVAPMDRQQMEIRRRMIVEVTVDAPTRTWWEACLWSGFELIRLELMPRGSSTPSAWAVFRNLEPQGASGVYRGAGLIEICVDEHSRRRGLAVFLMSEACRQFVRQGITNLTAQTQVDDAATRGLLAKLGLGSTLTGAVYRKNGDV